MKMGESQKNLFLETRPSRAALYISSKRDRLVPSPVDPRAASEVLAGTFPSTPGFLPPRGQGMSVENYETCPKLSASDGILRFFFILCAFKHAVDFCPLQD